MALCPQGLTIQNAYTKLRKGSKNAVVVVRNSTAYPQALKKKTPVARAVAATVVPEPPVETRLPEGDDQPQSPHSPKLTVWQRQGKLFEEPDLSGWESWPPELGDSACQLLAEYHDVFSLEPAELGCIHSTEHITKVTDDTLLKNDLGRLPHLWWKRFATISGRWYNQSLYNTVTVCGVMQLCWSERRMEDYTSVLISTIWTPIQKGLLPPATNSGGIGESGRCWTFSCLDHKSGFWQIKMEEASKQYTALTVGNLGFFECDCMPFQLCNMLATFQRLMQKCLDELNLSYCLIYLDNIIIFSWTAEEHLHQLHVVFDQFREYNLKLKPSKCSLFKEEINYLVHQVSKQGVQPRNLNLKAITECAPPQTYMEVHAFLSLMGLYWWFIKDFAHITQQLNEHLTGEGASRKLELVLLSEVTLEAFDTLKQACMSVPILAFANYMKEFLLEIDASKEGLGAVLSQKQADGQYHLVTYGSRALMAHEKNYHSTKLEFLTLKWVVTEHFKEYLP